MRADRSNWPLVHVTAAIVIAVLGVLVLRERHQNAELRERIRQPQLFAARHELRASSGAYELPAGEERYLLVPQLADRAHAEYRLELVDVTAQPAKSVWRAERIRREYGEPLEVTVSRAFLGSGHYRLDVYGLAGGKATLLEQFRLRVH